MSSYTMQLREYIEQATQDTDVMSNRDRIEAGRPKLFDFDYPIFDTNYKKVFETNFIRNFYTREIGFETEGLFKFKLENWLNINMPYYNKLFESELIEFDPLKNTDLTDTANRTGNTNGTSTGTGNQSSTGNSTENDFNRQLESDTPDTRLTITTEDGKGIIEYASKIDETSVNNSRNASSTSSGNSSTTTNANSTEEYLNTKLGKIGSQSYSKMVLEFRETFIRIEKRIFEEMHELFMLVY